MYSQRMVRLALWPGLLGRWSRTKRLLTPRVAPTQGVGGTGPRFDAPDALTHKLVKRLPQLAGSSGPLVLVFHELPDGNGYRVSLECALQCALRSFGAVAGIRYQGPNATPLET